MSYLDRIKACNNAELDDFVPLRVAGTGVGWLSKRFVPHLAAWPEVFAITGQAVALHPALDSFAARTRAVAAVTAELVTQGIIDRRHGELYPVTAGSRDEGAFLLDRAAAPYFGIRAFGQHINGFVRDRGELKMWIGKRALSKSTFPGKLDNMVAGGLPYGIGFQQNLTKECWEEAAIPSALARTARPVGIITYCAQVPRGLKPDVQYCYDLELPPDFVPRCNDGEVAAFSLRPVDEVAELVRTTQSFKMNCDLVIIHFLLRHGYITPEHTDYLALWTGLCQWQGFQQPSK